MTNEELNRIMAQADDRLDAMKDKLIFQEQEIKRLKESEEYYRKGFAELYKRIDESIEYIKNNACYSNEGNACCDDLYCGDCDKVLNILRGDKDDIS